MAVIVLNSEGKLIEMNFENKRPKRLYEKTGKFLKLQISKTHLSNNF